MNDDFLTDFPEEEDAPPEARPMIFVPGGQLSDIPSGRSRAIYVKSLRIAVFNVGGRLLALKDRCPHMGAYLSDGRLVGETIVCGWHGWTFESATGQCLNKDWAKVETYRVRVTGDRFEIEVPAD